WPPRTCTRPRTASGTPSSTCRRATAADSRATAATASSPKCSTAASSPSTSSNRGVPAAPVPLRARVPQQVSDAVPHFVVCCSVSTSAHVSSKTRTRTSPRLWTSIAS
ncbi:hypothetical protein CC85DRAFT_324749, partial [Cutaneotrichosporon oleaginosum]